MACKGRILQLQHYSVNDGDGIRTICDVSGVQIQKDIRRIIRFFILLPDVRTAAAVKLFARSRFLGISKTQLRAADV